jgi:hypothetical protein
VRITLATTHDRSAMTHGAQRGQALQRRAIELDARRVGKPLMMNPRTVEPPREQTRLGTASRPRMTSSTVFGIVRPHLGDPVTSSNWPYRCGITMPEPSS